MVAEVDEVRVEALVDLIRVQSGARRSQVLAQDSRDDGNVVRAQQRQRRAVLHEPLEREGLGESGHAPHSAVEWGGARSGGGGVSPAPPPVPA